MMRYLRENKKYKMVMRWMGKLFLTVILVSTTTGCQPGKAAGGSVQEMELLNEESKTEPVTESKAESEKEASANGETEKSAGDQTDIICSQKTVTIEGGGATEEAGIITISKGGTYRLSGTLTDGRIVVDASKDDVVILELNGFEISSSGLSAVLGIKSGEIRLKLVDGTVNKVADSAEYVLEEGEDEPDAAIFTKSDLFIEGSGRLEVTGNYSDGIRSKDSLYLLSGEIDISAKEDGIKGKDSLVVDGGSVTVQAGDDGIKSKGSVVINDGIIQVAESYEGIEALTIDINGGSVDIKSTDDGLNAVEDTDSKTSGNIIMGDITSGGITTGDITSGNKTMGGGRKNGSFEVSENAYIRIAGGIVTIDASADGIDSNGHFYVDGGELYISGPSGNGDGALDYNGEGIITGGVVMAAGSSGMVQGFSESSEQHSIIVYFENTQAAGTEIRVEHGSGSAIVSYKPVKEYSSVVISAPELKADGTYKIMVGEDTKEVTITGMITTVGTRAAGNMPGGPGGQGGRGMGGRPGMNQGENGMGFPGTEGGPERKQ
ncbi:carbohydrate-binding domain-containing protein [Clostridium sp. MCC353]|uniref:carbohydrate-binding domain-containing protein n=1 Tax=Clostridium sp. MCC353 TaxID=2592646 RepID=UPI001C02325F|nr:carbohydrate-binding domain-containing protein [Clostridium sp. MCC353]